MLCYNFTFIFPDYLCEVYGVIGLHFLANFVFNVYIFSVLLLIKLLI